jgi:hypothetical protein
MGEYNNNMEGPQVADGEDGIQVIRIDANVLDKEKRTDEKAWSSSLVVGRDVKFF